VDVHDKLDEITAVVESARSMPMSSSCVVNRGELLALLEELRAGLPEELDLADRLLADRESVLQEARAAAAELVAGGEAERDRLASQTEVVAAAAAQAAALVAEAEADSAQMRAETDDYVDAKLANFEITLTKTLSAVQRGRDKLRGRAGIEGLGEETGEIPPLPGG